MRAKIGMQMKMRIGMRHIMPRCEDCKLDLVRNSSELVCPRCGLVEDVLE